MDGSRWYLGFRCLSIPTPYVWLHLVSVRVCTCPADRHSRWDLRIRPPAWRLDLGIHWTCAWNWTEQLHPKTLLWLWWRQSYFETPNQAIWGNFAKAHRMVWQQGAGSRYFDQHHYREHKLCQWFDNRSDRHHDRSCPRNHDLVPHLRNFLLAACTCCDLHFPIYGIRRPRDGKALVQSRGCWWLVQAGQLIALWHHLELQDCDRVRPQKRGHDLGALLSVTRHSKRGWHQESTYFWTLLRLLTRYSLHLYRLRILHRCGLH